jgi:hypothetical protein
MTHPGRLFVAGVVAAAGAVAALGVWLREEVGIAPRELAHAVQRLEASADFARFGTELRSLFRTHPKFQQAFGGLLPVPPAAFSEPPALARRAYLFAPLGVTPRIPGAPLEVRWFDARTEGLAEVRSLEVRLCPARADADAAVREADEPRETGPLPLRGARRLADGSLVAELPPGLWPLAGAPGSGPAASGWTRIRIGAGAATEDSGWFRTTEPGGAGRVPLAQAKDSLLRVCRQGSMTRSQADLLLALLLEERGYDLAEARLLELLAAEQRSSPAAAALLRSAYGRLGRPDDLPREPARRDDAAIW